MKKRPIKDVIHENFPMSCRAWGIFFAAMGSACLLCLGMRRLSESDVYVPLIFVLMTLIVSLFTNGYFYGLLSAVTSVFAVNWAFTYPYWKLDFSIYGYPLTFLTILAVGFAVSSLTARLKMQERIKIESEREKMRANLLRAVSHDLRTPLTTISGSIAAVLEDNGTLSAEERRELLTDAKNDAEWLCRMVENLLSITRIDGGGNKPIRKQPEMLEEVISETVQNFKKHHADVDISVSVPDSLFFVEMDAMLIEQVLLNLMDNAVIHGGNTKKIKIKVTVENSFAVVRIADNGRGIDRQLLEHLFDGSIPLTGKRNADDSRSMGIGLSVCRTIVEAHGGTISAENLPGSGAEFTFTLPMEEKKYECSR